MGDISPIVPSVAFAVISSALFWWGSYRYFTGRITEWKKSVDEKMAEQTRRLERHIDKDEMAHERLAVLGRDGERFDKDITGLREYKHEKLDPYIGAMDAMNKRVERIEKYLNGNLK